MENNGILLYRYIIRYLNYEIAVLLLNDIIDFKVNYMVATSTRKHGVDMMCLFLGYHLCREW